MLHNLSDLGEHFHHEFAALREPFAEQTVTIYFNQVDVVVPKIQWL